MPQALVLPPGVLDGAGFVVVVVLDGAVLTAGFASVFMNRDLLF